MPGNEKAARILIAEDERDLAEMLSWQLKKKGYETRAAANGLEAWEDLQTARWDLLVLDLMMPELSGWEVCRMARCHPNPEIREIPILMLSARALPEDRVRGFEMGADDYVTKPFPVAELLHRVERLVGRRAAAADLRKKMEEMRDRLKEQEAGLREMIHDLKTPLISIGASAKLLMAGESPEENLRFLRTIYETSLHMTRWLDSILTYADVSREGGKALGEEVEIGSLAKNVVDLFKPIGARKKVAIDFSSSESPLPVSGEKYWLQRALENLVGNAVKFTPEGGKIGLSVGKGEIRGRDAAEIAVEDNGPGIEPEDLPRIFEPFFRGGDLPGTDGIGLGLAIVKRVADLHGGSAEVKSERGRGSRFSLLLPLADAESRRGEEIGAGRQNPMVS